MADAESHRLVWERFTSGAENVLEELYDQHYLGLVNYGRMIINDREFVNGCFMDMLIEFWNKRSTLPAVDNVRSYLLTSFRRYLLHQVDAEKKRGVKQMESQQYAEQYQPSYEEHIVRIQSDKGLQSKIQDALKKLTARQIEIIKLRFFEDLDYDEIALKCGITKRTAYNITYDALKILKEALSDEEKSSFSVALILAVLTLSI